MATNQAVNLSCLESIFQNNYLIVSLILHLLPPYMYKKWLYECLYIFYIFNVFLLFKQSMTKDTRILR